jgi:hypothetical protein
MALRRATKVLLCVHAAVASHEDASCPSHRGQGCAACVAHVDGRPGRWHGSPCVHTSAPEGTGKSKSDCMPASWWEAAKHPGVTCVGNATGCTKSCGSAPPAPPSHASCKVFPSTDFAGHDLTDFDANTPSECCSICSRTPGCGFYTFVPPVTCSLKTSKAGMRPSPKSGAAAYTSGCRTPNCSAVPLPPAPPPSQPQVCATGTVCGAKFSGNGKGCCPYENAVCCNNSMTCCPAGSRCQVAGWQSTCVGASAALTVGQPVCKPGAPLPFSKTLPNVLIIGDSVSIGYAPKVAAHMAAIALVQHSPWDLRDGGAEETAYGVTCLKYMLHSPTGEFLKPDVIMFNWGLHDGPLGNQTQPGQAGLPAVYSAGLENITVPSPLNNRLLGWNSVQF